MAISTQQKQELFKGIWTITNELRGSVDGWDFFEFKGGNDWNQIQKDERRAYLINAYRVLLTRARQGMVICVPEGDHSVPPDQSRNPKYYDGTYEYLRSLGMEEI